jgi:hypothetical protein
LRTAEGLELALSLKRELLDFRAKVEPKTVHGSYEHWCEGDHDDLVLATALSCWYREYVNVELEARNARQAFHVPWHTPVRNAHGCWIGAMRHNFGECAF